jgi:hypothetical protein
VSARRGIYFLANDRILDRVIAFLNSLRRVNPAIPLRMIPFADDIERLAALAPKYRFTIWRDDAVLDRCDEISRAFHGVVHGHYRKLAAWEGEFDEFVYIDSDTVVLRDVEFAFEYLAARSGAGYGFLTAHSHLPFNRRWVWKDSIETAGALAPEQFNYAAGTGFVCSRRDCLRLSTVHQRLPDSLALRRHMALDCFEQPLLNHLAVTSGWRYGSLLAIAMDTGRMDIPIERHATERLGVVRDGRIVSPERPPTLFVHWAGEWQARDGAVDRPLPWHELWDHYRRLAPPAR